MTSTPESNSATDSDQTNKRRRIIEPANRDLDQDSSCSQIRWKSAAEHHSYSSNLIATLRRTKTESSSTKPHSAARIVRETADRVLALAARGRTRWSRSILKQRRVRSGSRNRHRRSREVRSKEAVIRRRMKGRVERKVTELGRLVPGCAGVVEFEELVADYVAALEMQEKAIAAIVAVLCGGGGGGQVGEGSGL
ncbi:hypothetical protein Droror1_Dr00024968 [Drosera rotundifolia]